MATHGQRKLEFEAEGSFAELETMNLRTLQKYWGIVTGLEYGVVSPAADLKTRLTINSSLK